jgi:Mechanosensitive ion channel, conserved TM helix
MPVGSISGSVDRAFTVFFAWVPHVLGALAVLLIGYLVAKVVGKLVYRATHRAGLDRTLHGGPGGNFIARVTSHPSRVLGTIAFWAIMLATISLAASVLGIAALTAFVGAVFAYLPNVLAALAIFLVAGAVSAAVAGLAARVMGGTGLGKIVATAAPILIMTIATFMILDQLKIAHNIVVITYAGLLGAIALGTALAFGLGGREVAAQVLQGAYDKGQENKDGWKQDLNQGMSRAKDDAQAAKEKLGDGSGSEEEGRYAVSQTPATPPQR